MSMVRIWSTKILASRHAVGVVLPSVRLGGQVLVPQPVHVGACAFFPCFAVEQSQRAADDVAGRLVLAAEARRLLQPPEEC